MIYIDYLDEELEIDYDIISHTPGEKGNYTGLPEDCYEDTFDEIEWEITTINQETEEESKWNFEEITELFSEEIEAEIWIEISE